MISLHKGGYGRKKNTLCVPGTKTRHIPMSAILECGRLTPQTDPPFNLDSPGWRRKADEFYTHTHKLARIRIVRGEQNARLIINLNILLRSSGQISLRVARRRENAAALGDDELAGRYDPCSSSVFFFVSSYFAFRVPRNFGVYKSATVKHRKIETKHIPAVYRPLSHSAIHHNSQSPTQHPCPIYILGLYYTSEISRKLT